MTENEIRLLIELSRNAQAEVREIERWLQLEGVTVKESPHGTNWAITTPADRQGFEPFEYTERS